MPAAQRLAASVEAGTLCAFYGGLLTPKQQEMLRLYYEEDLSLGEIAEQMGVSRQNVHELIARSVQKLRHYEAVIGGAQRMRDTVDSLRKVAELIDAARAGQLPASSKQALDEAAQLIRSAVAKQEGEDMSHGV